MMTLDEAIIHAKEKAEELKMQSGFDTDNASYRMSDEERIQCLNCAQDHELLTEWLTELKEVKDIVDHWNDKNSSFVSATIAFEKILDVFKGNTTKMNNTRVIEILRALWAHKEPEYSEAEIREALDTAIEKVEEARWIPVSEDLPKEGNRSYLVTVDYGLGRKAACQRFFYNASLGWNDDCVIAWRPLPEEYRGEDPI